MGRPALAEVCFIPTMQCRAPCLHTGLGREVGRGSHPPTLADQHPRLPALEDGVCVGQCSPNVDVLSVALAKRCVRTVILLFRPFVSLFVETPVLLSSYVRELAKGERRYANP